MPKYRGVEVKVASQITWLPLPEYPSIESNDTVSTTRNSESANTVAVTIPIYKGANFYFDYSVDGPHPPSAIYYFKLSYKDQDLVSWDTTDRVNWAGKTTMALQYIGNDPFTGQSVVQRNQFQFTTNSSTNIHVNGEYMDVTMHRVEHRKVMNVQASKPMQATPDSINTGGGAMNLQLGGVLEAAAPKKYYQYQLVDPLDVPYVKFRFYLCTIEQLNALGFNGYAPSISSSISSSDSDTASDSGSSSQNSVVTADTNPKHRPTALTVNIMGVDFDIKNTGPKALCPATAPADVMRFPIEDEDEDEDEEEDCRPKVSRGTISMMLTQLIAKAKGRKARAFGAMWFGFSKEV